MKDEIRLAVRTVQFLEAFIENGPFLTDEMPSAALSWLLYNWLVRIISWLGSLEINMNLPSLALVTSKVPFILS